MRQDSANLDICCFLRLQQFCALASKLFVLWVCLWCLGLHVAKYFLGMGMAEVSWLHVANYFWVLNVFFLGTAYLQVYSSSRMKVDVYAVFFSY